MFTALLSVTNDKSWFVSGMYEDFDEHRSTCNINGFLQLPEISSPVSIKGIGTVRLKVQQYLENSVSKSEGEIILERVLYIPTMAHNQVCALRFAGVGRAFFPDLANWDEGHRNGVLTQSGHGIFALFCASV